jgi:DNA-binding protein HU-beta
MSVAGKLDLYDFLTKSQKKGEKPIYENLAEAKKAVDKTIEAMQHLTSLKNAEGLTIVGFGSFRRIKRAARKGVNPTTGEAMKIKPAKTLTFKVSKSFRDGLK